MLPDSFRQTQLFGALLDTGLDTGGHGDLALRAERDRGAVAYHVVSAWPGWHEHSRFAVRAIKCPAWSVS